MGDKTQQAEPVASRTVRQTALAFLFGGIFAVIGQLFTVLWLAALGPDHPLVGFAILVSMGVLAVVMFVSGLHQRLEPLAGFGLVLPFNGFCAAVSSAYLGVRTQTGSAAAGIKAALKLVAVVLGSGVALIFVVAVIAFFVGR